MSASSVSRRRFIGALPLTVLAAPSLPSRLAGATQVDPAEGQEATKLGFSQEFTAEEATAVAGSPIAAIIGGLQGQGYPCSEMMLLAALRRFELPEDHLDAAAVFGGGVGKRDLCGFLTGGLMAIGFASGEIYEDRRRVHTVGRRASNAYWDWWLTRGDLHCMGPLTSHETSEEFVRMAQRAAVKLEEVMGVLFDGGYEVEASPG